MSEEKKGLLAVRKLVLDVETVIQQAIDEVRLRDVPHSLMLIGSLGVLLSSASFCLALVDRVAGACE